jgi:acetylornithine deacetylase
MNPLEQTLAGLEMEALTRDAARAVQIPSPTGQEKPVLEFLADLAEQYGLLTELVQHDIKALETRPGYPGREAEREELWGLTIKLGEAKANAPRLCINGHVDVVSPGSKPWTLSPWSGAVEGDRLYGRGSLDMKGSVVAALHALAAIRKALGTAPADVVMHIVASEEDGGIGAFAALEQDSNFSACLIVEPTEQQVVCAQAGALTFKGMVPGRSAHAAVRLAGYSAIDRYVRIHQALAEHEGHINGGNIHPLLQAHALPYPILVGKLSAGDWSSTVPDRLEFEGRLGVRVGQSLQEARAALEAVIHKATDDGEAPVQIGWTGGQFGSGQTPTDHPFTYLVQQALGDELQRPVKLTGVTYGADMRLYCERGIPTLMAGVSGLERAHAVDEWVSLSELMTLARMVVRVVLSAR